MFLIGRFGRNYYSFSENRDPMEEALIVNNIDKTHLSRASEDEDYQVINIITREYFDPKQNKWISIKEV